MTGTAIAVSLTQVKKEKCGGKCQTSQLWRSLALPFSVGLYVSVFQPRNYFHKISYCSLQQSLRALDFLGHQCMNKQCSPLFTVFGDSFQWHFADATFPLYEGIPQRKLVHDLRCQPVNSLWHCVDSSEWSMTWWFSCLGVLLQMTDFSSEMLPNCLENFWQWVLEIPLGWVPLLLISTFWFQLPI